jgi:hypothetical protein
MSPQTMPEVIKIEEINGKTAVMLTKHKKFYQIVIETTKSSKIIMVETSNEINAINLYENIINLNKPTL